MYLVRGVIGEVMDPAMSGFEGKGKSGRADKLLAMDQLKDTKIINTYGCLESFYP